MEHVVILASNVIKRSKWSLTSACWQIYLNSFAFEHFRLSRFCCWYLRSVILWFNNFRSRVRGISYARLRLLTRLSIRLSPEKGTGWWRNWQSSKTHRNAWLGNWLMPKSGLPKSGPAWLGNWLMPKSGPAWLGKWLMPKNWVAWLTDSQRSPKTHRTA